MNEFLKKNRNKLAAAAALTGLAVAATHDSGEDAKKAQAPTPVESVSADGTDVIGRSDSGWDQGAAERAIEKGLEKATRTLGKKGIDVGPQIAELPTYDNSMKAVEIAREDGAVADKGDKMKVTIEVTADSDSHVSYEVKDAEIVDLPNSED